MFLERANYTTLSSNDSVTMNNVLRDLKKNYYRKTAGHVFTKPVQIE